MSLSPREELLNIQRHLWRRNKDIIEHSILVKEPGFARYEKEYLSAVSDYERIATQDEMLDAIRKAQLIYVGDYHTCNQSQRSFLRILKAIQPEEPNIIICLELIHCRHQKVLDDFLEDRLSEESFVKKIGLRQRWIFDLWGNFKPIFDFAKYYKLKMFGVDAASINADLDERDEVAAKRIAKIVRQYPRHKIFVFIGDFHLAPEHLPEIVLSYYHAIVRSPELAYLILYQNSDSIYWKLAEQELEHRVEVVRINDRSFCRMHTPPIVYQQSYLNWLEHEEGEIDYADAKASFLELVDQISKFLDIDLGDQRDKVDVFTSGDLSFFRQLRESGKFTSKELSSLKRQILSSESYYIAKKRFVYLANLSINHAAEEATHFIKHVASGLEKSRDPTDAFYANILHEALAFFGSKLINHKRKCFHEKEFRSLITYFETVSVPQERKLEFETAQLVLEFLSADRRRFDRRGLTQIRGRRFAQIGKARKARIDANILRRPDLFYSVTHALGYMLGDKLFYALMAEKISKEEIRGLFYDPWSKKGKPEEVYDELSGRLRGVRVPKRM